jgi:type II secretory pathway pseudopilin PulG
MAVVVIVGVLATLATVGLRKYVFASKSSEAVSMIGAIMAAQEAYRSETFAYATPTITSLTSVEAVYPQGAQDELPGRRKWNWDNPGHPDHGRWMALSVTTNQPVIFGYTCVAGAAGSAVPAAGTEQPLNWPTPTGPWYVVRAIADQNGDGVTSVFVGSSFTSEIHHEYDDE